MNKPNLFIVGFPKSGTSSLYNWLKQHPKVTMSYKKEPSFFATDFKIRSQIQSEGEYLKLFEKCDSQIIGEASTTYIYSKNAARNIKEFQPKAKIIVIYRDYPDMLESLYIHRLHRTGDPIRNNFERWFERRFKGKEGNVNGNFYPFWNLLSPYSLIKEYIKVFGRRNVFVIDFKNLKENPRGTYDFVCKFLKIPYFEPDFSIQNKSFGPKSRLIEKLGFLARRFLNGDSWKPRMRFWERNRSEKKPAYLGKSQKADLSLIFERDERRIKKELLNF